MTQFDTNKELLHYYVKQRILEVEKSTTGVRIANFDELEAYQLDHIASTLVANLTAFVAKEDSVAVGATVPITWWDHFKQDVLSKYFKKIQWNTSPVMFRATTKYPSLPLSKESIARGYVTCSTMEESQ